MEAFNFTVVRVSLLLKKKKESKVLMQANEDNNLYTFDMRKLDKARNVHKDHISAV